MYYIIGLKQNITLEEVKKITGVMVRLCVLRASTVKCQSIPSTDPQSTLDQYSIDRSVDNRSTSPLNASCD